ncbi:MAG: hypothetical protein GY868_17165 [Deltaproteobacteria bacterium]|nr:hypothetical protein [Deltaproteobacteria bacterium]
MHGKLCIEFIISNKYLILYGGSGSTDYFNKADYPHINLFCLSTQLFSGRGGFFSTGSILLGYFVYFRNRPVNLLNTVGLLV